MCRACRGLIAANADVCPLCGAQGHYKGRSLSLGDTTNLWTVTNLLIGVNVTVYALILLYQSNVVPVPPKGRELDALSPVGQILGLFGSVSYSTVMQGQYWRLIAYCFLHGGLLHLGFNCYALYRAGREAEDAYGSAKFFCLYLISGIVGGLFVMVGSTSAVGASGAICGLIGALAVYGYKRGDAYGRALKSQMLIWAVMILLMSLMPGVSMAGHLGGFVAGAGLGYIFSDATRMIDSQRTVRLWQIGASIATVLTIACLVLGVFNAKREVEALRIRELSSQIKGAARTYAIGQSLTDESLFDEYRRHFSADITVLEQTNAVDSESAGIREQLLAIFREKRDQLIQAHSLAEARPIHGKWQAFERSMKDYQDWLERKSRELGKTPSELDVPATEDGGVENGPRSRS